jgi:dTDP-4-amino-4,6-dideoxygalactose transaminase
LTDIQSALGITQLAKNKTGVERRNEIATAYKKAFEGKIKFQFLPNGMLNAHHLFVIEVENRKEVYDYLHANGILAQIHYIPVHILPYYKEIGYKGAELINAEYYYSRCISLPMFPSLTDEEQDYVIEKTLNFI